MRGLLSWARATGDLAADAVADLTGGGLPVRASDLTAPTLFNELASQCGRTQLPLAEALRVLPGSAPSSNCTNATLEIDWEADSAQGVPLPRTLYLKLPAKPTATRAFCNAFRIWERECLFYRNVAAEVPIRTPVPYIVALQRSRFVLVLEDLSRADGVGLHDNHLIVEGPSLSTAYECLSAFATLHSRFWGLSQQQREQQLPEDLQPINSPSARANGLMINRAAMYASRRKAPNLFSGNVFRFFRKALKHWDTLVEHWFTEPLTLIHGDSHIGNFFKDGDRMGMLDWQAAQWGQPLRDVQYFLIDSVPVDVLSNNETQLVQHYVGELAAKGVKLSFDAAWQQYRSCAFQTLMTAVVSHGLGVMTDMDDVIRTVLERSIAATERLDLEGWLDGLVGAKA